MKPIFEVKKLSTGYETPVVQEISFSVFPGEIVGLLGRNGEGKTTLLRGITGGTRVFSGEVWVQGESCAALSVRKQATRLSLLPQQTEVMEGILAKELIAMGLYPRRRLFSPLRKADHEAIRAAADKLGVADLLQADCGKLSQGQRKLILLTRLLVQDAPVLLLDEPDAALDFYNTHLFFSTLRRLVKDTGKAALAVLHHPELALRQCDRLLILKDGRLAGEIHPKTDDSETIEATLRLLYPSILVQKDEGLGQLHCYFRETN